MLLFFSHCRNMASQHAQAQEPQTFDPTMTAVISANTKFAWQLFHRLSPTKENVLFSPFSITIALGMTFLGTRTKTASQVKDTMNFENIDDKQIHEANSKMQELLMKQNSEHVKLHVANRLYGQNNYSFLSSFLEGTVKSYNAEFGQVDFSKGEAVRTEINKWVEKQTAEKIKNLIGPDVLTALTRLVLVNAVYFKGDWQSKFDKKNTHQADFYVSDSETIKVDMMFQEHKFPLGWNEELKTLLLELPYVGKSLSLFILLPSDKNGLKALEGKLTEYHLNDLEVNFRSRPTKTEVWLPRFVLDSDFSLRNTLSAMGMPDLFTEGVADLSGMDGTRELYVSAVLHKAFMEVNKRFFIVVVS